MNIRRRKAKYSWSSHRPELRKMFAGQGTRTKDAEKDDDKKGKKRDKRARGRLMTAEGGRRGGKGSLGIGARPAETSLAQVKGAEQERWLSRQRAAVRPEAGRGGRVRKIKEQM